MANRYPPLKVYAEVMIPAERFGLTGEDFIFDMDKLTPEQKKVVGTTLNMHAANAILSCRNMPYKAVLPDGLPSLNEVFATEVQAAIEAGKVR